MSHRAFVYTELQVQLPFAQAPWRSLNPTLLQQPGLRNKTWLSGVGNHSIGGIYEFESIESAQKFVTGYFPSEAKKLGAPQTTRIFDGSLTEAASVDLHSPHFGRPLDHNPGAFVYTEVQLAVPFAQAPWRIIDPNIRRQPGFMAKTWLSGLYTQTVGGIYAFDTVDNAIRFAVEYFPGEAHTLNAAFTTRVFDATVVEEASRGMNSVHFPAIRSN